MKSNDFFCFNPPKSVQSLPISFLWRRDLINYDSHPAYADLVRQAGVVQRAVSLMFWLSRFVILLAKRIVRYEMIPSDIRNGRSLTDRARFMGLAVANVVRDRRRRAVVEPNAISTALAGRGVAVVAMSSTWRDALACAARPHFDALAISRGQRVNRREFDESRATATRVSSPELYELIESIFTESGLFAAASAYKERHLRLIDVNPQINDPSDSFWRDIFEDMGSQSLPRTAYCHRDSSGGDVKVIIYMSDVDGRTGAFSYAVGSNMAKISLLDDLICEANDHNGMSATELDARRKFAALPVPLRQKGSFGNDLDDQTQESQLISDSLWEIAGPSGLMVAFDTKGIHRGGMVIEGERRVLTCVLG